MLLERQRNIEGIRDVRLPLVLCGCVDEDEAVYARAATDGDCLAVHTRGSGVCYSRLDEVGQGMMVFYPLGYCIKQAGLFPPLGTVEATYPLGATSKSWNRRW